MDNAAEKVDKVSTKSGLLSIVCVLRCPLYGVAGRPLFRVSICIEVNGRTVGTFRIVCYIVSVCC